jgi:hypothetical protein
MEMHRNRQRSPSARFREVALPDPNVFRERARRCRELLQVAIAPEVIEQLKVWSNEFDADADKLDAELTAARRALRQSMLRRSA